jgi:NAD+ diphosphatase
MPYEPPKHCGTCGASLSEVAEAPGQRRCSDDSCGRITYLSPIPVVAAIVEHEGDVVLVRGQGWPETWFGLVTGFLEPKESPEEAARREAIFQQSVEAEKTRGDALSRRFEEALKQARDEPITKPTRDFDLD